MYYQQEPEPVKPTLSNQRLSSVTLVRSVADAPARRRVTSTFSSTTPSGLAWPAPDFKVLVLVRLACFESRVGYRTRSKVSSSFCVHSLRARTHIVRTGHQTTTMEEAFGKSFAKAQQLHGISLSSFIASVSLSAVMFTIEVLVFLAIRKCFPDL